MSDPSVAETGLPPKRGWYDDPQGSGKDRWWNGYEWTEHTARTPRKSLYGPGYERAFRTHLNRPAGIARWLGTGAIGVLLVLAIAQRLTQDPVAVRVFLGLQILQGGLAIAAIVLGIAGVRRSRIGGGLASAIWSIAIGAFSVLGPLGLLVFLIASLVSS